MHRGLTGHFVPISTVGEYSRGFVPHPLPPVPPVHADGELGTLLDAAADLIKASQPTVNMAFKKLIALRLVHEITGGNYGRLYA